MGRTHHHDRSEKEARTWTDLGVLERMRAPWFFDAEVQRRLRTGDSARRAIRWRRMRIAAAYFVLGACIVAASLQFGDRLLELIPQAEPPAVPRADTLRVPPASDTSRLPEPAHAVLPALPGSRTMTLPAQDSIRVPAASMAGRDSTSPVSPSISDSNQGAPLIDTARRIEPQLSVPRADTSLTPPDSLGSSRGTP